MHLLKNIIKSVFILILVNGQLNAQDCFGPVDGSTVYIDCAGVMDFSTAVVGLTNRNPPSPLSTGEFGDWTILSGPGSVVTSLNTATLNVTAPGTIVIENEVRSSLNPGTIATTCTQEIIAVCYADDRFVEPNIDITTDCPVNVTLILDESGSIADSSAVGDVETAVNTLVSELAANTETNLSIIEFETVARSAVIGGNTGFQFVDAAYAADVAQYLINPATILPISGADNPRDPASYAPGEEVEAYIGGTNWQAALEEVDPTSDIVIFVTDGNPTFYNEPDSDILAGVAGQGNFLDMTALIKAQTVANTLKEAGAHLFFLGVGPNVLLQPIKEVSGEDEYVILDGPQAFCEGDFSITNFGQLEPCLEDIAAQIAFKQQCEEPIEPIPTMGEWGLICLSLLMMIFATIAIRQRDLILS